MSVDQRTIELQNSFGFKDGATRCHRCHHILDREEAHWAMGLWWHNSTDQCKEAIPFINFADKFMRGAALRNQDDGPTPSLMKVGRRYWIESDHKLDDRQTFVVIKIDDDGFHIRWDHNGFETPLEFTAAAYVALGGGLHMVEEA